MKPPNKVGMANVRNQAPLSTLSTIDFIEALSLTRGNGILGIGSPRNWHRGSQPFLSKKIIFYRWDNKFKYQSKFQYCFKFVMLFLTEEKCKNIVTRKVDLTKFFLTSFEFKVTQNIHFKSGIFSHAWHLKPKFVWWELWHWLKMDKSILWAHQPWHWYRCWCLPKWFQRILIPSDRIFNNR